MAWYDVGTVSVTNGSTTVTGAGTDFISGVQVGEGLYIGGDLYEIGVVNSSTQLTLSDAYLGSTATGQAYKIIPTQSLVADLSSGVADLISDFADVRDYAGNGKFNDGTQASPAITFTQDQNNGLYRIGSDNWGLAAGGAKALEIKTTGVNLDDGKKITFGASDDLQIYHDGSNSWIQDLGAGSLILKSDGTYTSIQNSAGNDQVLVSSTDVKLANSGNTKLATTATGVDVTGTITADGLTSDGGIVSTGSFATVQARKDGGDTFGAGATLGLANAAANRIWFNQLSSSNNYDYWYFDGATPRKRATFANNGDVSFYEDTGTTAKMVWDASAESLSIGTAVPLGIGQSLRVAGGVFIDGDLTSYNANGFMIGYDGSNAKIAVGGTSGASRGMTFSTVSGGVEGERLRIDPEGNVGIGTASPSGQLHVTKNQQADTSIEVSNIGSPTASTSASFIVSEAEGVAKGWLRRYRDGSARTSIGYDGNFTIESTAGSERARIDSSGNLLVGTTSTSIHTATTGGGFSFNKGAGDFGTFARQANPPLLLNRTGNSDGDIMQFRKDGLTVGSIGVTGSTTSYNTSSDERLKENIQNTTHNVDIDDIQVREFDWKVDGSHQRYGFIAQELEIVYPEAVHSPEDADEMKSVDYSKLVPLLVKEIQQLKAEIKGLKA